MSPSEARHSGAPAPLVAHVLRDHVLLGALPAALLWVWHGPAEALLFWVANVAIDVDHYLHFLVATRFREWTPRAMFRFCGERFEESKRPDFLTLEIFHTAEFLGLSAALTWSLFPSLWPALAGGIFHMVVDWVHLARHGILSKRANSFVGYWLTAQEAAARLPR